MNRFRKKDPSRQVYKGVVANHGTHRKRLGSDFNSRCGYCDAHVSISMESYHIDHFAPQSVFKGTDSENRLNEYTNLMYSCPSCNLSKSDKWVTDSFDISFIDNIGFMKPCNIDYANQFQRDASGAIEPQTPLGSYMFQELSLGLLRHSLIWKMDTLTSQINKINSSSSVARDLKAKCYDLLREFKNLKGFGDV